MKKLTLYLASDEIRPRVAIGLTAAAWLYSIVVILMVLPEILKR